MFNINLYNSTITSVRFFGLSHFGLISWEGRSS